MEEVIKQRIETLQAQRAQLVQTLTQARQQSAQCEASILQHDGAIAELSALLRPAEESKVEAGEGAETAAAAAS